MSRQVSLAAAIATILLSGIAVTPASAEDLVPNIFLNSNATRTQVAEACHEHSGTGEGFNGSGPYECFTTVGYIVCNANGKCGGGPYARYRTGKFTSLFGPDQRTGN